MVLQLAQLTKKLSRVALILKQRIIFILCTRENYTITTEG